MNTTAVTTTDFTVTDNAESVADFVNDAVRSHAVVKVNGRVVSTRRGRRPATGWMNGSFSCAVVGRKAGTVGDVWAKVGATVTVTVEAGA